MLAKPDNYYDLAIVDPPYFQAVSKPGYYGANTKVKRQEYKILSFWDIPGYCYFKELKRVSKNQIVWGINYYCFSNKYIGRIIWDKIKDNSTFSKCEIAGTNLIESVQIFRYMWNGMLQQNMKNKENRIHPTQKPIALYKWLLQKYAKPGWTIFDSHVGSGSIRIACHDLGFDFEGCEIDNDYWQAQEKRFNNHIMQGEIFDKKEIQRLSLGGKNEIL
jgi:site-specific DNA-methyltransferase (adenine-specific)